MQRNAATKTKSRKQRLPEKGAKLTRGAGIDAASGDKPMNDADEAVVSLAAIDMDPEMEMAVGDPSVEALAGVDESLADTFGNVDDVDVSVVTAGVDVDDEPEVLAEAGVEIEAVKEEGEAEVEAKEGGDEPQSFLAMYFRDMAELDVLRPEQEFETARHIEQLELELWHILLGFGPGAQGVADIVEGAMAPQTVGEFGAYRVFAEKNKRKATLSPRKAPEKVISDLGAKLKEVDIDRIFVEAAAAEIQRVSRAVRGERQTGELPEYATAKGFLEFADAAASKMARVKRAKNEFVKANLRLVVSIARRFNHGRLPLPDLIQEGNIGLMKAVERYDYRRGFRFSTYASWWIRHAISRALADKGRAVRLPVHMIDAYHKIAKSERELQSKLERPATTEEIATATGIEAEKLEKMKTFLAETPVSLDKPISDEDGRRLIDVLVDPNEVPSPPEQMMNSETQLEMIKLLGGLKPIEADILRKRFGLVNDRERTLKEIGDEYHLSRERVRQLQEQALGKMRRAMAKMEPS